MGESSIPGKQAETAPQPAAAPEAAAISPLVPLPGGLTGEWLTPPVVLALQRNAGNAAVTRFLSRQPHTKTAGEQTMENAHDNWLDPAANVKDEVDALKAALREIKRGKN